MSLANGSEDRVVRVVPIRIELDIEEFGVLIVGGDVLIVILCRKHQHTATSPEN